MTVVYARAAGGTVLHVIDADTEAHRAQRATALCGYVPGTRARRTYQPVGRGGHAESRARWANVWPDRAEVRWPLCHGCEARL